MKKKSVMVCLALLTFTVSSLAADFEVVYLDGVLEAQQNNRWTQVYIGDLVPEGSSIRLAEGTVAELASPSSALLFSKPGVYLLEDAARQSKQVQNSRVASIFEKIGSIGSGPSRGQSAAMGVRGAEAEAGLSLEWVEEDSLSYDEAVRAFENGNHELAATILEEEVDPEELEDSTAYWYYLTAALISSGSRADALKVTFGHSGEKSSSMYAEYLLLRGRLYLEALDFASAGNQYAAYLETVSSPAERQLGWYFYGFAMVQAGNAEEGERALRRAAEIGADPEITEAARTMTP